MVKATQAAWLTGIEHELAWWRSYLESGGLDDPGGFRQRFDPETPLQPHIAAVLPEGIGGSVPRILDCAAGPATTLGKTRGGRRLEIVAIDALADRYQEILDGLGLVPPVPSLPCEVEHLDTRFEPDGFDLVYMRFALDHCYDPLAALRQMVRVARPGGAVMVEHYRDATQTEYQGLRQWALRPEPGDLVVANENGGVSVRAEFPGIGVEIDFSPTWLTLLLRP